MTLVVLHSLCIPDRSARLSKTYFKLPGTFLITAPANAGFIRVGLVAAGGEGEDLGGNGAFAYVEKATSPGEVFQIQIGQTHSGGNPGNTWIKRQLTGDVICFADRGRGSGEVQGNPLYCIGDIVEGGVYRSRSGGDSSIAQRMGLGGRWAANNQLRACGPGGGGRGGAFPYPPITKPAGCGAGCVEFYAGAPGF